MIKRKADFTIYLKSNSSRGTAYIKVLRGLTGLIQASLLGG